MRLDGLQPNFPLPATGVAQRICACGKERGRVMLSWSITFLVIALIAALLGFSGIAGMAAGFAKILFAVFLVLFVVSLLFGRKAV
jgi:uncharacterized membrane protein YtjA (UPF0391 family)